MHYRLAYSSNVWNSYCNGEDLKDINDIMPKIPGLRWGVVTNFKADKNKLQELDKMMPNDKKWHTLFETPDFDAVLKHYLNADQILIDGVNFPPELVKAKEKNST